MSEKNNHVDLETDDNGVAGLPENAFRELGADEEYHPVMHPGP